MLAKFFNPKKCLIEEPNIQENHVHLIMKIPPKVAVSELVGTHKGTTAIRGIQTFEILLPSMRAKVICPFHWLYQCYVLRL